PCPPLLGPQVEYVVQKNVRQKRRRRRPLRGSLPTLRPVAALHNACAQPFADEPPDSAGCNPMLDELHQPSVVDGVEETTNVCVEYPVHLPSLDSDGKRIQRIVLASLGPEPVREAEEIHFVDGVEHLDDGSLDKLVLQRCNAERPLPPIRLRDVRSASGLRPIRSSVQPFVQALEV